MAVWDFVKAFGFSVTVLLLLVSCSIPLAGGDSFSESVELDVVVDTLDANRMEDILNEVDIHVDSCEDVADTKDVFVGDTEDVGDIPEDATSDALVCGDVPKEGCPCDKEDDEPCCIMTAQGLSCGPAREMDGVWINEWGVFWDCGCIEGPECEGYEIYPLCPWESRKEYY